MALVLYMLMQNLLKRSKKIKKSHTLLIGSFLIFVGLIVLSSNYLLKMREEVFSNMKLSMMKIEDKKTPISETPNQIGQPETEEYVETYEVDYSIYYGILEIPKIGLKRGFHNIGSKYNNIQYNVTMLDGSTVPTEGYGNLILMAHSGNSYISYFAYLYRLEVGDDCYITINGETYHYKIVNIYDVGKSGAVTIDRNYDKMSLTLITCTKDNDSLQTIYIAEIVG